MRYVRQIVLQSTLKTWMLAKNFSSFRAVERWSGLDHQNSHTTLVMHPNRSLLGSCDGLTHKKRQWVLMVLLLQQQTPNNNLHAEKKTHSCYVHAHKEKTQRADLEMRSISFSPISKDEEFIRCQMLPSQNNTVKGIHACIACTQNWRRRVGTLTDKMKSHLGMSGGEKTNWDYA